MLEFQGKRAYTVKEVCEILGLGPNAVRLYLSSGKLAGQKLGKKWIVPEESLLAFFEVKKGAGKNGD